MDLFHTGHIPIFTCSRTEIQLGPRTSLWISSVSFAKRVKALGTPKVMGEIMGVS